jgi:hypothetical protein
MGHCSWCYDAYGSFNHWSCLERSWDICRELTRQSKQMLKGGTVKLNHTHSRNWDLLEKPPVAQLQKNFPVFDGTRRFIAVFTRALQWSLSLGRSIKFISSHSGNLRSIIISSTQISLGLPSGLFPSGFPTNILYAFLFSSVRATYPLHLILLDLIILIIKLWSSPLYWLKYLL